MPAVLTEMVLPVALVFHLTVPEQPVAIKFAVSALHKLFLSLLITGEAGFVPLVITTALLTPLSPQVLLQVAV